MLLTARSAHITHTGDFNDSSVLCRSDWPVLSSDWSVSVILSSDWPALTRPSQPTLPTLAVRPVLATTGHPHSGREPLAKFSTGHSSCVESAALSSLLRAAPALFSYVEPAMLLYLSGTRNIQV